MRGFIATLAGLSLALAIPIAVLSTAIWLTLPHVEFYENALTATNAYERTITLADEQFAEIYTHGTFGDATAESVTTPVQILPSDIFTQTWLQDHVHIILNNTIPLLTTQNATLNDMTGSLNLQEPKTNARQLLSQIAPDQLPFGLGGIEQIETETEAKEEAIPPMSIDEIINGIADEVPLRSLLITQLSGGNILFVLAPGLSQITSGPTSNSASNPAESNNTTKPDEDNTTINLVNDQLHIIQNSVGTIQTILWVAWIVTTLCIGVILLVLRGWKSKIRGVAWCLLVPTLGVVGIGISLWIGSSGVQGFIIPFLELSSNWSGLLVEIAQNIIKQFSLPILWMSLPLAGFTILLFILSAFIKPIKN